MACSKLIQIHTTSTKILYLLNTMYVHHVVQGLFLKSGKLKST